MGLLKRFFSRFVRLQWKLALSYSLVTTLIVTVALLGLLLFAYTLINVELFGVMISSLLPQMTEELPPYLEEEEPDAVALGQWLDTVYNRGRLNLRSADLVLNVDDVEYITVTDATGRIIAGRPPDRLPRDLRAALSAEAEQVLDGVLGGELASNEANYTDNQSGVAFLASPIIA